MNSRQKYFLFNSSSSGPTAEYAAVLAKATSLGYILPSDSDQTKQNAFIVALKAAGIWSHLDALRVWKNSNNLNFAGIDWINPNATRSINVNSPTLDNSFGVYGDGASSYVNTKINLNALTKYTQDNASAFCYIDTVQSGLNAYFGAGTGGGGLLCAIDTSGNQYGRVNSLGNGNDTCLASGLQLCQRLNAITERLIQNGTSYPYASPSMSLVDQEIAVCARNINNIQSLFTTSKIALFAIGDGLAGLESSLKSTCDNFYAS